MLQNALWWSLRVKNEEAVKFKYTYVILKLLSLSQYELSYYIALNKTKLLV